MQDTQVATADLPGSGGVATRRDGPALALRPLGALLPLEWRVAFDLMAFAVMWRSLLAYTSLSPPVGDIEQLTRVRSLE